MGIPFARGWKWIALRGVAAWIFGFAALLLPVATLPALIVLFGEYALVDGALAISAGARSRSLEAEWLLKGFLGAAAGLLALLWVGITLPALVDLLAFWAISAGILDLRAAKRPRNEVPGEIPLSFAGAGSLLLGLLLIFWPAVSVAVPVILLGSYAMLLGTSMLVFAWQLRKLAMHLESTREHAWRVARRHYA